MTGLLNVDNLLSLGIGVYTARQFLLVLAAERGRKRDLVKRRYQGNNDFQIAVLVPFLSPSDLQPLLGLIQSLEGQAYPASRVAIHVVCTPETALLVDVLANKPQLQLWTCPIPGLSSSLDDPKALAWLVDRCIAQGGSGWMVFLRPTDVVKNDFFQNIVARGYDSFVLQGYTALKMRPQSWVERVWALDQRLNNRIENAGRFHLGWSARLMPTGWAIKREVLEMVPIQDGAGLASLAYTVQLNQHQFRISWAPTVVAYESLEGDLRQLTCQTLEAMQSRLSLLLSQGPRLLVQGALKADISRVEQALSLALPPASWVSLALVLLTAGNLTHLWDLPGRTLTWALMTATLLVVNLLGFLVARCQVADLITAAILKPLAMLAQLILAPVVLVQLLWQRLNQQAKQRQEHTLEMYRNPTAPKATDGYWSQGLDPALAEEEDLDAEWHSEPMPSATLPPGYASPPTMPSAPPAYSQAPPRPVQAAPQPSQDFIPSSQLVAPVIRLAPPPAATAPLQPKEQVISVPILYGNKQVQCLLKVHTDYGPDGSERYQVTMAYKQFAFSSSTYRILDQAFYELHAKLQARGLTMITCGSCGNFYNPTADVPGALRTTGVCLFGKHGKDVNLQTDAVSVISQACPYHCDISQRESIVRQWRDSLSLAAVEA
jgi:hypothetical protein